ncbi:MAG: zinc ribbon domain-containing protein [Chloroflexi bacterium]|nr:zinc ribbon domain-containing protein [Chloroflexota bacterium]MBM3173115.1 zinc ribbon domain-containing protein [Chloroflexota bacterium]MBM3175512.1 zinc ribbon domain-containing protein [Chloroflexota bacterium]MBM4450125.1 zinc ribbon domain-containing protein [Chloroflexota bacterium]
MPIYEYVCSRCNHRFELRQSFGAESATSCPRCHNGAQRLFAPVPIIFKGSGFYVTDSKKSSAPAGEVKAKDTAEAEKTEKPERKEN